jgi:DNA-binding PadR family transcriptional regulator
MTKPEFGGQLETLLLAAIAESNAHGYQIIEWLRDRSGGLFDCREGTVYPALHRLERDGLLDSIWTEHAGRRRRVYRLNGLGETALREATARWRTLERGVDAVLEGVR